MVPGEESPTLPGDESEAIDCQPLVCVSPVVDSQLAEAHAGMLCPVVDDPKAFLERMRRQGLTRASLGWDTLWKEFQAHEEATAVREADAE